MSRVDILNRPYYSVVHCKVTVFLKNDANVTTFASTGLKTNKTYYFRVRAYNANGNSVYSNTASTKTLK